MILRWSARVLGIIFILFLGVFALDVFDGTSSVGQIAVGLFMHLLPSLVLLVALVLAWLRPLWGSAAYLLIAIFSIFFFSSYNNPTTFAVVSAPTFILGLLFYLTYLSDKKLLS